MSDSAEGDVPVEDRARARQRSLRKDYLPDVRRAVTIAGIGVVTWPMFLIYDYVEAAVLGRGSFAALATIRILGELVLVAGYLLLRGDPPPTHRRFHQVKAGVMFSISAVLALMCLASTGLTSIYVAGNMGVALALVFSPQPFLPALSTIYLTLAAHPLVLTIGCLVDPRLRAQLDDPNVTGVLVQYAIVLVFLGAAAAGFSHTFYGMRRELHLARGIGRYQLRRLLGEGASSEVWAAYHTGLEREVALKILEADVARDHDARKRFAREVRAAGLLTHPNAIRVFDHGTTEDGLLYCAMELVPGPTLADFVAARGALPIGRALHLCRKVGSALNEAHVRGIVHRDVKPENVLVTTAGLEPDFPKVLDFGIATLARDVASGDQIETGELAGTPTTVSPEVIGGLAATPASDVYGMGVVLYFVLTGEYPFASTSSLSLYASHLRDTPPSPSLTRGEALPADLEALVLRCLAKNPAQRPADAGELAHELDRIALRYPWDPNVDAEAADRLTVPKSIAKLPRDATTTSPRRRRAAATAEAGS